MADQGTLQIDAEAGERLDRVLQAQLPELSRTAVQRLIEEGRVRVDGKIQRAGYRLRRGEHVTWEAPAATPQPSELQPEAIPLDILFED